MGRKWAELVEMQAAREAARPAREAAEDSRVRPLDDAGLRDMMDLGHAAEREFNRRFNAAAEIVANRIKCCEAGTHGFFTPDELTYAARDRCSCGAGLAYPDDSGMHGRWLCSAILTGQAAPGTTHTPPLPFQFYDLKSENSAGHGTTRPGDAGGGS